MIWESLLVVLVSAAIISGIARAVGRARWRNKEKRILQFLRDHSEDRPGKQYISIKSVAQGTGLDVIETTDAADRSPKVFRRETDEGMIGLYKDERSVYEERGVLTL